jgi:hypothetical protein
MARKLKIFFSFHYERDAWRAGQVRNCNVVPTEDQTGYVDAVDWESIQKQGDAAIEKWIAEQLEGTSATAVLIGAETSERDWVQHEIIESWNRGNGVFGIWIHNVKDCDGKAEGQGHNPLDDFKLPDGTLLSSVCKTYDWVNDNGRDNMGKWAEEAAKIRAKYGSDVEIKKVKGVPTVLSRLAAAAIPGGFKPPAQWSNGNRRRK